MGGRGGGSPATREAQDQPTVAQTAPIPAPDQQELRQARTQQVAKAPEGRPASQVNPTLTAEQERTYVASFRFQGETLMADRTTKRDYTHASVVQYKDTKPYIASFHGSEAAALKGTLTGSQRKVIRVIAAVPLQVTKVKAPRKPRNTK